MGELDVPPSWTENITAIQELTNDKAPGLNGVSPECLQVYVRRKFVLSFRLHHRVMGGQGQL